MSQVPDISPSAVVCLAGERLRFAGRLLRCTPYSVAFEVYGPEVVLHSSEVLDPMEVRLQGRTIYSGRATVSNIVTTGTAQVCEANLEGGRLRLEGRPGQTTEPDLAGEFKAFLREWQRHYKIQPDYKLIVADMHAFFTELWLWLDEVELGQRWLHGDRWPQVMPERVAALTKSILPIIDELFERFEATAAQLDPGVYAMHADYMRRLLHPLVLASPFAHRTFTKPLGYAGDYEMVNMLARDPREGPSLFAQILNVWFIEQPPARAHRNRLRHLTEVLVQEALRTRSRGEPLRVLDIACGPAIEVQQFLETSELSSEAEFTLVDFNDETLEHARARLEQIKRRACRQTGLRLLKRSVQEILKGASRARPAREKADQQFDLCYCAGLFDYLPDAVCQRLMDHLYDLTKPGGLVLATNVDPSNPLKHGMAHLLDWNLIHRSATDMLRLKPERAPEEAVRVHSELTGVNVFIEVRKPDDE